MASSSVRVFDGAGINRCALASEACFDAALYGEGLHRLM
jgi:hypothetical protein